VAESFRPFRPCRDRVSSIWGAFAPGAPGVWAVTDCGETFGPDLAAEGVASGEFAGAWLCEMALEFGPSGGRPLIRIRPLGGRVGRPAGDFAAAVAACRSRVPGCDVLALRPVRPARRRPSRS
jgi:hypothetical protein